MKKNHNHIYGLCGYDRAIFFKKYIGEGKKILDIGCGGGEITQFYSPNNQLTGIDFNQNRKEKFIEKTGGEFVLADFNDGKIDFPDEMFDVVVASEVLYYIKERDILIKEIYRVLKKDGIFLGSIINTFSLPNKIRFFLEQPEKIDITQKEHIYFFSYKRLKNLLKQYFPKVKIISFSRLKVIKDIFPFWFSVSLGFYCKK